MPLPKNYDAFDARFKELIFVSHLKCERSLVNLFTQKCNELMDNDEFQREVQGDDFLLIKRPNEYCECYWYITKDKGPDDFDRLTIKERLYVALTFDLIVECFFHYNNERFIYRVATGFMRANDNSKIDAIESSKWVIDEAGNSVNLSLFDAVPAQCRSLSLSGGVKL